MTAAATDLKTSVTLSVTDSQRIILVLSRPRETPLGVVMDQREADALAGRLRKVASDVRAAKARQ